MQENLDKEAMKQRKLSWYALQKAHQPKKEYPMA